MPSSEGMAVEVRQSSVELKNKSARRSYWRPWDVTEILKIVVVKLQLCGGLYTPRKVLGTAYGTYGRGIYRRTNVGNTITAREIMIEDSLATTCACITCSGRYFGLDHVLGSLGKC
jgi:hypothetical protein